MLQQRAPKMVKDATDGHRCGRAHKEFFAYTRAWEHGNTSECEK